jgi:hypothetical protein
VTIAAIGLSTDEVISYFVRLASEMGAEVLLCPIDRVVANGEWSFCVPENIAEVTYGTETMRLQEVTGVLCRPIFLPDPDGSDRARWSGLEQGLITWLDTVPLSVANRPGADSQNSSKPLHEAWLQHRGLRVPESLSSSDELELRGFACEGPTVIKPLSGVRAHCRELDPAELIAFDPRRGPIHIQRMIAGDDVRVHVVGTRTFACRFESDHIDYRTDLQRREYPTEIPQALATILVELSREQGLLFAGWDLKVDRNGQYWCLEANPMPAYDLYDRILEGEVSRALIALLNQRDELSVSASHRTRAPFRRRNASEHTGTDRGSDSKSDLALHRWMRATEELDAGVFGHCVDIADTCSRDCLSRAVDLSSWLTNIASTLQLARPAWRRWDGLTRREILGYDKDSEGLCVRQTYQWLAREPRTVDVDLILEIHERAVGGRLLRNHTLVTRTRDFPPPETISSQLRRVVDLATGEADQFLASTGLHLDLLALHPFTDGNGRTARLAASAVLFARSEIYNPLVVMPDEAFSIVPSSYIEILNRYDQLTHCRMRTISLLLQSQIAATGGAAHAAVACGRTPSFGLGFRSKRFRQGYARQRDLLRSSLNSE